MSDSGNEAVFTQLIGTIVGAVVSLILGVVKHVSDKRKATRRISELEADLEMARANSKNLAEELTRAQAELSRARASAEKKIDAANDRLIRLLESRVQALTEELSKATESLSRRNGTGRPSAPKSETDKS